MNRKDYGTIVECSNDERHISSSNHPVSDILSKRYEIRSIITIESFDSIANTLRTICPHLKSESNPLLALMTYRGRRYFLPVFYALVRLFKGMNSVNLASRIRNHIFEKNCNDDGFAWIFLKDLETQIDPKLVEHVSEKFTFDTLIYCGMNGGQFLEWEIYDTIDETYEDKVESRLLLWWERVKEDVLRCYTEQEILQIVQWIVKTCFPIVNTTKGRVFVWDPFDETWCLVLHLKYTLEIILNRIWYSIKRFAVNELNQIGFEKEENPRWLKLIPEWSSIVNNLIQKEKESYFKIHEDVYQIRQLKHNKIVNKLSVLHEAANVPELYILNKKIMRWLND